MDGNGITGLRDFFKVQFLYRAVVEAFYLIGLDYRKDTEIVRTFVFGNEFLKNRSQAGAHDLWIYLASVVIGHRVVQVEGLTDLRLVLVDRGRSPGCLSRNRNGFCCSKEQEEE